MLITQIKINTFKEKLKMRQPIIAGNWKMNNTIKDTKALLTDLIPLVDDAIAKQSALFAYLTQTFKQLAK